MTTWSVAVGVAVVAAIAAPARIAGAQSINVSFGHTSDGPAASYAAAGTAGVWNTVTGIDGSTFDMVGLDGHATGVTMTQSPTTTTLSGSDPSVSGDDAKLLNTGLDTTGAETCLAFAGMAAGDYEVLVYAWTPNQPSVKSRTRQDSAPATIDVGGAWTGDHVEGVTYARYMVTVGHDGALPAHSGLAPNMPSAALNGVQIRSLSQQTGGGDAGVTEAGDAGTTSGGGGMMSGGGGCSTTGTGDTNSWAMIALVMLALSYTRSESLRSP
jgi:hypothetical protein